jgi:hypothetical protein
LGASNLVAYNRFDCGDRQSHEWPHVSKSDTHIAYVGFSDNTPWRICIQKSSI